MPKRTRDFPDRVEFSVPHEMRVHMIALGFLTGSGLSYSRIARNLLGQAIEAQIKSLPPDRLKAFQEIVGNVELKEANRTALKE